MALKVLNGSADHHPERQNPNAPAETPLVEIPEPPTFMRLTGRARTAWNDLAARAIELGVLTSSNLPALASLCLDWAEYMRSRVDAESWRRADAAKRRYDAGLARFGLNPSDVQKVRSAQKTQQSKMAGLLKPRAVNG